MEISSRPFQHHAPLFLLNTFIETPLIIHLYKLQFQETCDITITLKLVLLTCLWYWKLTWHWKIPMFNRNYIFNESIFHHRLGFRGCVCFLAKTLMRIASRHGLANPTPRVLAPWIDAQTWRVWDLKGFFNSKKICDVYVGILCACDHLFGFSWVISYNGFRGNWVTT